MFFYFATSEFPVRKSMTPLMIHEAGASPG